MTDRMLKNIWKTKTYQRLSILTILVASFFMFINRNSDILGYLVSSNAVFLIYNSLYFSRVLYRYIVYKRMQNQIIIRMGIIDFYKTIHHIELINVFLYLFGLYGTGLVILSKEYIILFWGFALIYISLHLLLHLIRILFIMHDKYYVGILISYVVFMAYNYNILPILLKGAQLWILSK